MEGLAHSPRWRHACIIQYMSHPRPESRQKLSRPLPGYLGKGRDPTAASGALGSGSEARSYLRLLDFVYHSTLGLRVIRKTKKSGALARCSMRLAGFLDRAALIRQTRPDSGLGFQVKLFKLPPLRSAAVEMQCLQVERGPLRAVHLGHLLSSHRYSVRLEVFDLLRRPTASSASIHFEVAPHRHPQTGEKACLLSRPAASGRHLAGVSSENPHRIQHTVRKTSPYSPFFSLYTSILGNIYDCR